MTAEVGVPSGPGRKVAELSGGERRHDRRLVESVATRVLDLSTCELRQVR